VAALPGPQTGSYCRVTGKICRVDMHMNIASAQNFITPTCATDPMPSPPFAFGFTLTG
jgi:hypothetical protein